MKNEKKISKVLFLWCLALVCLLPGMQTKAATLYESPYVSFSPGDFAWTVKEDIPYTDRYYRYHFPDDIPEYWYPEGERIYTGIESSLRALNEGEHYYCS